MAFPRRWIREPRRAVLKSRGRPLPGAFSDNQWERAHCDGDPCDRQRWLAPEESPGVLPRAPRGCMHRCLAKRSIGREGRGRCRGAPGPGGRRGQLPGIQYLVVGRGFNLFEGAAGWADLLARRPLEPGTTIAVSHRPQVRRGVRGVVASPERQLPRRSSLRRDRGLGAFRELLAPRVRPPPPTDGPMVLHHPPGQRSTASGGFGRRQGSAGGAHPAQLVEAIPALCWRCHDAADP
jgi:hypothetical protein